MSVLTRSTALIVGAALGLVSAFWSVGGQPPLGVVRSGSWRAWPGAGAPDADPYARAVLARDGRLALAPAIGLRFLAAVDDDGRSLDGRCDYTITGPMPRAEAWTLTLLDRAGFPAADSASRAGFTSSEPVRAIDGRFVVVVAPGARPGNWLPSRMGEPFQLMLSIYGTPLGAALRRAGTAVPLPSIARDPCP